MIYTPKDFQKTKPFPWLRVAGAGSMTPRDFRKTRFPWEWVAAVPVAIILGWSW